VQQILLQQNPPVLNSGPTHIYLYNGDKTVAVFVAAIMYCLSITVWQCLNMFKHSKAQNVISVMFSLIFSSFHFCSL